MHDHSNHYSDTSSNNSEQHRREHPQWVIKYLDLADTALQDKKDEQEQAA